jgi:hypothetical protein
LTEWANPLGVRSYVTTLGRFIQANPVDGGSANA